MENSKSATCLYCMTVARSRSGFKVLTSDHATESVVRSLNLGLEVGNFPWVCVKFRACVLLWRLNDLTSSRALETRRRCSLRWVLRRGNRNGCEGVMEMSTSTLGARHPGSCWRCWMVNPRSKIHVGRASRLASVLGEAMDQGDDGAGTFAGRSLVVVVLRVSREHVFEESSRFRRNVCQRYCTSKVGPAANVGGISNCWCHGEAPEHCCTRLLACSQASKSVPTIVPLRAQYGA